MSAALQTRQRPCRRASVKWIVRQTERLLAVVGAGFLLYALTLNLSVVSSESMSPTLKGTDRSNGDWVLTERVSYWFRHPRRWEIVTFRSSEGLQVMKRVAGLPCESVSVADHAVSINHKSIAAPGEVQAVKYLACGNLRNGRSCPCGDGYYVLGDCSEDSQDSRFDGPIADKQVIGRAWLIVWPPSRIRFLTPG